jgi:hypothetical protein
VSQFGYSVFQESITVGLDYNNYCQHCVLERSYVDTDGYKSTDNQVHMTIYVSNVTTVARSRYVYTSSANSPVSFHSKTVRFITYLHHGAKSFLRS